MMVGPERQPFSMHKDVLCKKSPYFAIIFSKRWNREKPETELKDADPDAFEVMLIKSILIAFGKTWSKAAACPSVARM